uniref:Transmembrane protein 97 n=1 Tax=Amazona collaria TaxID=241587 RepID=A0A8B9G7K5_9PSIT
MAAPRWRERLFALFFLAHVPLTALIDSQPLLPAGLLPPALTELLQWYATTFRDPLMLQPPAWFKAFIYCEALLQLPFFPIAAYAFLKGWCKAGVRARPVRCCRVTPAFCTAGVEVWVSNGRQGCTSGALPSSHGKSHVRQQNRTRVAGNRGHHYRPGELQAFTWDQHHGLTSGVLPREISSRYSLCYLKRLRCHHCSVFPQRQIVFLGCY